MFKTTVTWQISVRHSDLQSQYHQGNNKITKKNLDVKYRDVYKWVVGLPYFFVNPHSFTTPSLVITISQRSYSSLQNLYILLPFILQSFLQIANVMHKETFEQWNSTAEHLTSTLHVVQSSNVKREVLCLPLQTSVMYILRMLINNIVFCCLAVFYVFCVILILKTLYFLQQ
jgi:hypothetical protein